MAVTWLVGVGWPGVVAGSTAAAPPANDYFSNAQTFVVAQPFAEVADRAGFEHHLLASREDPYPKLGSAEAIPTTQNR